MKSLFVSFCLFLSALAVDAQAVSVCYNNVCGRIVCASGCIQQAVNGVCVVNTCTGHRAIVPETSEAGETGQFARCTSCAGNCCAGGNSFLSAEQACKAQCGSFGCFTRCN